MHSGRAPGLCEPLGAPRYTPAVATSTLTFHPGPANPMPPISHVCVCVALTRGALGENPGSPGTLEEFLSPPSVIHVVGSSQRPELLGGISQMAGIRHEGLR